MKTTKKLDEVLKILSLLESSFRLQILIQLRKKEKMKLTAILKELESKGKNWMTVPSPSNVCEHLQFLKRAGLIRSTRIKRIVYWELNGDEVSKALGEIENLAKLMEQGAP